MTGVREQRRKMPLDTQLRFLDRHGRVLAVPGQQIEGQLRIENFLRLALERKQADGLLLQLLNAAQAPFACGLENMRQRTCDLVFSVKPVQDERDGTAALLAI